MTARPPPTRELIEQLIDRVEKLETNAQVVKEELKADAKKVREAFEADAQEVKRALAEIKILIEAVAVFRTGGHFVTWLSKLLFSIAVILIVWKSGLLGLLGVHHLPD